MKFKKEFEDNKYQRESRMINPGEWFLRIFTVAIDGLF